MRAAVYRVLYGEDFIEESIRSVLDSVDKVYVFWTDKVWGGCTEVVYNGETIQFPKKFDASIEIVKSINSNKISLIENYQPTPLNQYTHLVNDYVKAESVLLVEPDQVMNNAEEAFELFEAVNVRCAAVPQIEYWKTREYRIPDRNRCGPIFWKPPLPSTAPNGLPTTGKVSYLKSGAHNYGFCVSEKVMYWKHLTAIAFSSVIDDSIPREDWYEEVWKKWVPEMENLEISKHFPSAIPYAYKIR